MCYHCNNSKKRVTMRRPFGRITQTAGLCLFCYRTRGSDYRAQGWRIVEDVILKSVITEDVIMQTEAI